MRGFFYLEGREPTLETAMDKVRLSLTNFASEVEREGQVSQRVRDMTVRTARGGHVIDGLVYGYRNVEVRDSQGHRLNVERQVDDGQAAVVRRIFALCAEDKVRAGRPAHRQIAATIRMASLMFARVRRKSASHRRTARTWLCGT